MAAQGWQRRRRLGDGSVGGDNGEVPVAGARSGSNRCGSGGTEACGGGGGDNGWTPSPAFREQPLEMEETPFFSQMTARVCGGFFPSYRAHNRPSGERAHLRPTTQNLNIIIEIKVHKEEGLHE